MKPEVKAPELGFHARREVTVPAWPHTSQDSSVIEGILDVEAVFPALGLTWHFDATIRNPLAKRYRKRVVFGNVSSNAASMDGFACV